MSGLIIGSISSVVDASRYRGEYRGNDRYSRDNSYNSRQQDSSRRDKNWYQDNRQSTTRNNPRTPEKTTNKNTDKRTEAPIVTTKPSSEKTTPPVTETTQVEVIAASVTAKPPVDTAKQAQLTVVSQAENSSLQKVTYVSQKISNELRDRLFIMAAVIGMLGAIIYAFSFITPLPAQNIMPTRRIIPVMEG